MRIPIVLVVLAVLAGGAASSFAAPPELEAWYLNNTGLTGFNGISANVQRIRYSAANAYINASGVPSYSIGPWPNNPNTVTNQNALVRIPRLPTANTGTKTSTPLGAIGLWVNGVAIYNALDAMSYNNQGKWHQNAVVVEAPSFDACLGHPPQSGQYHHHQHPICLDTGSSSQHSRLLGYAFDGFPVYGPYGYANSDGSGGVTRMKSGYQLRNITTRTTLPDGTVLMPMQYGPAVSTQYPLGYYIEDFEYVSGPDVLDAYNGRIAVTPEYPGGTYAYYTTVDANGASAYPYVVGPSYYGVVADDNITSHQHVIIAESVSDYTPTWLSAGPGTTGTAIALAQNAPNPAAGSTTIAFSTPRASHVSLRVFDLAGRVVATALDQDLPAGPHEANIDASRLSPGAYFYELRSDSERSTRKMLLVR